MTPQKRIAELEAVNAAWRERLEATPSAAVEHRPADCATCQASPEGAA